MIVNTNAWFLEEYLVINHMPICRIVIRKDKGESLTSLPSVQMCYHKKDCNTRR